MRTKKVVLGIASGFLALCLCGCIVLSSIGTNPVVMADDDSTVSVWNGSDTDDSWLSSIEDGGTAYTISSAAQLASLAEYVNDSNASDDHSLSGYTVDLEVDIDLAGYTWTPIGTMTSSSYYPFSGTFNGNYHIISGLYNVDSSLIITNDYIGLFGYINTAKITSLTIKDVTLKGRQGIGAVVGWADLASDPLTNNSTISGCSVTGQISITGYSGVGGILGIGEKTSIENCSVSSDESGSSITGKYFDFYNYDGEDVGGIAGFIGVTQNTGLVSQMKNVSVHGIDITGCCKVGGILGYTDVMGTTNNPFKISTTDESYTNTVTDCTITLTSVSDFIFNTLRSGQLLIGAVLGATVYDMTIENCSIVNITIYALKDKDCVYTGDADNGYANAGYYGGSTQSGIVTLENCSGSATIIYE